MKRNFLSITLVCLALAVFLPTKAKDVYGFMTGNSSNGEVPIGMYKFDTDSLKPQLLTSMMYQFWGGAYADGKYMMLLSDDATGYLPEGLCTYDIDSKKLKLRYSQQPYQCSDLTYDYSTSTLYGVMVKNTGEEVKPRLIKIDTTTGSYTKVAELQAKIVGLACTYFGDMYAIDANANLYEMDKSSGELSLVGSTGISCSTSEAQSMEFDRATDELYWSGLDENDNTFFCQLDPSTAQVVKKEQLSDNSLIVGLHIPFAIAAKDAPAKPNALQANVDDNGVTLTWTNPSATYGGASLGGGRLTKVEVWKAGRLIGTISDPVAGQQSAFTDKDVSGGKVRYVVYAYNEAGRGDGASVRVLAGEDTPGTVANLKATKTGDKVKISWTAPTVGKNGGSIKPENLVYTVTRMPDGAVFDGMTDTVLIDDVDAPACYYTWNVACRNAVGTGNTTTTQAVLAGSPLAPPYSIDFDGKLWRSQWRIVDNNGDGCTWSNSGTEFVYNTSYTNSADDSLVSVPFRLKANANYAVKYDIVAPNVFSSEHFRLSLKGGNGERVLEDLDNFTTPGYTDAVTRTVSFIVDEDGDYQFCMAALSKADQFLIKITAFAVDIEHDTDLSATGLQADGQLYKDSEATLHVAVSNVGVNAVDGYTVKLLDGDDNELASTSVAETLAHGDATDVKLSYTPTRSGLVALKAVAVANGDGNAANDTIATSFNVMCVGDTVVEMGGKDYYTDFPFWFGGYKYSYAQAIYNAMETGGEAGDIRQLQYDYVNNGSPLADIAIKIYLANTKNTAVTSGWIDEKDMTLVCDTAVTFLNGSHTLFFDIATPFAYTGGNLCVMTQKTGTEQSDDIYFYAAATDEPRTAIYNGDNAEVNLSSVQAATRLNHVRIVKGGKGASGIATSHAYGKMQLRLANDVACTTNGEVANFTVTDLSGKTLAVKNDAKSISLATLPSGIYIVKAESNGQRTTLKVAR